MNELMVVRLTQVFGECPVGTLIRTHVQWCQPAGRGELNPLTAFSGQEPQTERDLYRNIVEVYDLLHLLGVDMTLFQKGDRLVTLREEGHALRGKLLALKIQLGREVDEKEAHAYVLGSIPF